MMVVEKLTDQIKDGTAKLKGDRKVLGQLVSTMTTFELGFEILTGTKGKTAADYRNDFKVGPMNPLAGRSVEVFS